MLASIVLGFLLIHSSLFTRSLVRLIIGIELIAAIIQVSLVCLMVGILLISPGIQLFLCMGLSRHFFHNKPPF